jgi:hypothetical protein
MYIHQHTARHLVVDRCDGIPQILLHLCDVIQCYKLNRVLIA